MTRPRNTSSDQYPVVPGIGAQPGQIEEQEAEGTAALQQDTCEVIPSRILQGTEEELTEIGFELGPVDKNDPLFREARLPPGWRRRGTGDHRHTSIVDTLGRDRIAMFYKAAFYDRDAYLSILSLDTYIDQVADGRVEMILDETWATTDAVLEAIARCRALAEDEAAFWASRSDDEHGAAAAERHQAKVKAYVKLAATVTDMRS